MRLLFSNISCGFVFSGEKYGELMFSKYSLIKYIEEYKKYSPEILGLTEVLFDNESGESEMLNTLSLRLDLKYKYSIVQSPSHVYEGKFMGIALLSKYPIKQSSSFFLPNPKIEFVQDNGEVWKMFDKGALKTTIIFDKEEINIFVLSYFPFHHFKRKMNEEEFKDIRISLLKEFLEDKDTPTIIMGDFNNKGFTLMHAFPELFEDNQFTESLITDSTVVGEKEHLDHILFNSDKFSLKKSSVNRSSSDHYSIFAEIKLSNS